MRNLSGNELSLLINALALYANRHDAQAKTTKFCNLYHESAAKKIRELRTELMKQREYDVLLTQEKINVQAPTRNDSLD
jgi:hypothetical protein